MKSITPAGLLGQLCLFIGVFLYHVNFAADAIALQNMEENCVLSFVVPREKMKSSCNGNERIKRRINTIEKKVNVYRQQLMDLENKLSKERKLNADKINLLENNLQRGTVLTGPSVLLERVALLERDFGRLSNEFVQGRSVHGGNQNIASDLPDHYFNAIDKSPVTMPNLVKSMVRAEVQTAMADVTKKFELYVQEQILLYGKVFNIISKPRDQPSPQSNIRFGSQPPPSGSKYEIHHGEKQDYSDNLKNQFDKVKEGLDKTGEEIANKVKEYIHQSSLSKTVKSNVNTKAEKPQVIKEQLKDIAAVADDSITDSSNKFPSTGGDPTTTMSSFTNRHSSPSATNSTIDYEDLSSVNSSELSLQEENGFDVNDSYSGDSLDANDTTSKSTISGGGIDTKITGGSASSRISGAHGSQKPMNKTESTKRREDGDENTWNENMIMDQEYKAQAEANLMTKVRSLLYQPLAEMMSLVEKQYTRMAEQLKQQREISDGFYQNLSARVRINNRSIGSNSLQLDSISQAVQTFYLKMDKMSSLEESVKGLEQNISMTRGHMPITLNEQGKRLKKMERLVGVYQQSLEHFKNDTRTEYKQLRESLMKETIKMKIISKNLKKNVTGNIEKIIYGLNESHSSQMKDMKADMRHVEDDLLLMNIDLKNLERKVNTKNNKMEKEMSDIRESIDHFSGRSRDFRKKTESLNKKCLSLETRINSTSKIISDLKTEVKLTLTDNWLPIEFDFDGSWTNCFGDQYLRRTKFKKAMFVGVVLCSAKRYKIYLGDSLEGKFLNIGDGEGMGEDHCEFVGGSKKNKIKMGAFTSFFKNEGFTRESWGQEPRKSNVNTLKPTRQWYECGVTIP